MSTSTKWEHALYKNNGGGRNRVGRREKWPKKSWEEGEIGAKSREEGEKEKWTRGKRGQGGGCHERKTISAYGFNLRRKQQNININLLLGMLLLKDQFRLLLTVTCLVAWPLNENEAGGDLVLKETFLLFLCKVY